MTDIVSTFIKNKNIDQKKELIPKDVDKIIRRFNSNTNITSFFIKDSEIEGFENNNLSPNNNKKNYSSKEFNNYTEHKVNVIRKMNNNNYLNFNSLKNDKKLIPINSTPYSQKINKIHKITKINNIINSLIETHKNENKLVSYRDKNYTNKYPIENSISPVNYIKYNLQKSPLDLSSYNGIRKLMKEIGKMEDNKKPIINMVKKVRFINTHKIESDHLNFAENENNRQYKKYLEMLRQTKKNGSFHFNHSFSQNKKRFQYYELYQNISNKAYKNNINKSFEENKTELPKINKSRSRIDAYNEKNINKFIPFDTRIDSLLRLTKKNEAKVKELSKEHQKMMEQINNVYKPDLNLYDCI